MNNRPIILTDWQVRAAQEGRLTQIRVPVVPQPQIDNRYWRTEGEGLIGSDIMPKFCPFQPGDILYVREAWKREECTPDCAGREDENECPFNRIGNSCYRYKTQYTNPDVVSNWHFPATMPKEAARLFLTVGKVRVQRASEATEEDAIAEVLMQGMSTGISMRIWLIRSWTIIRPHGTPATPARATLGTVTSGRLWLRSRVDNSAMREGRS